MNLFKKYFSSGFTQARLIFSVGLVTLLLVFGIISYDRQIGTVSAGADHNMSGWAWSDTIGWISFNNLNEAYGPSVYGVNATIDPASGNPSGPLSGYAWSSNIGWISFQCVKTSECFAPGEPNFPQGGELQERAQMVGTKLQGWARACSVFITGCNGGLKSDDVRGGWDGWISLSGSNPKYGVEYDSVNKTFGTSGDNTKNFAWGDTNLGWINFQPGCKDGITEPSRCGVILGKPPLGLSACEVKVKDGIYTSPVTVAWEAARYTYGGAGGPYKYSWSAVKDPKVTCTPDFPTTPNQTNGTFITTCSGAGTVKATVTVRDSRGTPTVTSSDTSKCGVGITVLAPQPGFSISAVPNKVEALFLGKDNATTSPVSEIKITTLLDFKNNITLTGSVDSGQSLTNADVDFQFSDSPTGLPVLTPPFISTFASDAYGRKYLQLHLKKPTGANGAITVTITGTGGDLTRTTQIKVNVDKGVTGAQEQ